MKPVLLIGLNYVREQRWVVLSLALYPPAMLVLLRAFDAHLTPGDLSAFLQQQASFAVLFAVVFAASAINQDRRSRRILGVLSKAVRRSQYIAGLLLGVWLFIAIYAGAGLLTLAVISRDSAAHGFRLMLSAYVAAMASSAVTMFFTTFLPPFLATLVAGIFLGIPALLQMLRIPWPNYAAPAFVLMRDITLAPDYHLRPDILLLAVAHALVFWVLASVVFSYRDIAVSIE